MLNESTSSSPDFIIFIISFSPCRKQRTSVGPSKTLAPPRRNIVGCRIQHIWKEGSKWDSRRGGGCILNWGVALNPSSSSSQASPPSGRGPCWTRSPSTRPSTWSSTTASTASTAWSCTATSGWWAWRCCPTEWVSPLLVTVTAAPGGHRRNCSWRI